MSPNFRSAHKWVKKKLWARERDVNKKVWNLTQNCVNLTHNLCENIWACTIASVLILPFQTHFVIQIGVAWPFLINISITINAFVNLIHYNMGTLVDYNWIKSSNKWNSIVIYCRDKLNQANRPIANGTKEDMGIKKNI